MAFSLARFRDLAFGRTRGTGFPLADADDARRLVAGLPADDPLRALADLTYWAQALAGAALAPERHARILLELDQAARALWQRLGELYLAPRGGARGREGDPNILRAFFDSASAFADGFAAVLEAELPASGWIAENLARLIARNLRWLDRRLSLAHMLALPVAGATWERLHRRYRLAEARGLALIPVAAAEGAAHKSTARREYLRALLLELADPAAMAPREIELAYRAIAGVAGAARLEPAPASGSAFAVLPEADARPQPLGAPGAWPPGTRYLDLSGCLAPLRERLEADAARAATDPDPLYAGFTFGERRAVLARLLANWSGPQPAARADAPVSMALPVRMVSGYDDVIEMVPPLEKHARGGGSGTGHHALQLKIDDTTRTLGRAMLRAAQHATSAAGLVRLVDASAGELGLAVPRNAAAWAHPGALTAVQIEIGGEWVVGALRRVYPLDDELRLAVQVLSARPRSLRVRAELAGASEAWASELRYEPNAPQRLKRAILLDPALPPRASGALLLPPRCAAPGSTIDFLLEGGERAVRVAQLIDDTESFQRVTYARA